MRALPPLLLLLALATCQPIGAAGVTIGPDGPKTTVQGGVVIS
jgi:hypothetical protein